MRNSSTFIKLATKKDKGERKQKDNIKASWISTHSHSE